MVRTLNADRSAAIKKRNTGASGTGRTRRGNVRMADTVLNSGNAEMGSRGRTRTGRRAQTTAGHTGRPAQARRSSHAVKPAAKGVNGVRVDEASLDASPSVPIRRTSAMSLHKVGFMIILIVVMTVLLINYIKLVGALIMMLLGISVLVFENAADASRTPRRMQAEIRALGFPDGFC